MRKLSRRKEKAKREAEKPLPPMGREFRYIRYAVMAFVATCLAVACAYFATGRLFQMIGLSTAAVYVIAGALAFLAIVCLRLYKNARINVTESGIARFNGLGLRRAFIPWQDVDLYTLGRLKTLDLYLDGSSTPVSTTRCWVIRTGDKAIEIDESIVGWHVLDAIIRSRRKPPT